MSHFFKAVRQSIKHWYIPLIVGIIFVALGIWVMASPLESYLGLALLFSISFIVAGISETLFAISNKDGLEGWGWYLVGGLLNLLIGIFLVAYPGVSIVTLPFVIGFTVMFRSFQALGFAYDLKNYGVLGWGNMAIWAVLGILFSFILIFNPELAGLTVVICTGLSILFAGVASIFLSLKLKKIKDIPNRIPEELKDRWESLQAEMKEAVKD
ncbi:MAG: HdeD family acid-resistance protein [Flavobacteriaceae bacterium]